MDVYHVWCDLKSGVSDVEFADAVTEYMTYLTDEGRIRGWRMTRRKLGLGHPNLPEFNITMEFDSMTQMDDAFNTVSAREDPVEGLHHAVNARVGEVFFALYRDFPDPGRVRGQEKF